LDKMHSFLALLREPISFHQAEDFFGASYLSYLRAAEQPAWRAFVAFQAGACARSKIRSLRVLNALQTHLPAASKEVPKLTELGLPAETITDPFTGEPLHVKRSPQGWLIYSVGPNFRDDGGNLQGDLTVATPTEDTDVGIGPPPMVANDQEKNGGK
jgi:hypothetical protein